MGVKKQQVVVVKVSMRHCLKCQRLFQSIGSNNRLCKRCNKVNGISLSRCETQVAK